MVATGRRPRKQKPQTKYEMNLVSLIEQFQSEDTCRAYLASLRWPNGMACLRCGSLSVSEIKNRNQISCNSCRYQFSVTVGTIFQDSHLPLWKWFLATYIMVDSKKGVSANQLKRMIKVSYKTAWYLCHRIREAMAQATANAAPLSGIVEADETFVGGRRRHVGHGFKGNKAIVVGVVQRGGEIRLQVATDRTRQTLHEIVLKNTVGETEAIYTDDWPAYQGLADADTRHETVNHSAEEYVRGDVHTNTVEGVWSLLERSIMGSYHQISIKHLPAYVEELEWRFSQRENPFLFRDTMKRLISAENLPYQKLTG